MNVFAMKTFEGINPRVGCYADSIPRAMSATPKFASSSMTREVRTRAVAARARSAPCLASLGARLSTCGHHFDCLPIVLVT